MDNITIKEIPKKVAVEFVQQYHYSKIMPRLTKYYLGFYCEDVLSGVVTLGWGTQPRGTLNKIFPGENLSTNSYLEIGKMCFLPCYNNTKNFGSRTIKILKKWITANTETSFLYTLADGIMGKCGYVYQASNFIYIGKFKTSVYLDRVTMEKIHPRSAKQLCIENAAFSKKKKIFWLTQDFCEYKKIDKINGYMFRYILPIGKKAQVILDKHYPRTIQYPKDNALIFEKRIGNKYVQIPMPKFNMNIFNHNYQKY